MSDFCQPVGQSQPTEQTTRQNYADIVIVGAGISGLGLAWRLKQIAPQLHVVVLEAASRPGGTAWTDYDQGFTIEYGPNGFLATKTSTFDLARELGLENELIPANPESRFRYVLHNQKLYLFPSGPLSLLRFPLLSWSAKWSIFTETWRRSRPPREDESVYDFVVRRTNREVADLFAELLVTGIYAGDPKELSMRACFPRLATMELEAGSITAGFLREVKRRKREPSNRLPIRRSQLYSFRAGLRQLIESLATQLASVLHLNHPVNAIRCSRDGELPQWNVCSKNQVWSCRQLILACPAYVQAELIHPLDREIARLIQAIPYLPLVVIALAYRCQQLGKPIRGFGYLTTSRSRSQMLGSQWCSCIFSGRAPSSHLLMRFMAGGARRPHVLDASDQDLTSEAHREASRLFAIEGLPVFTKVIRWPKAIPQYPIGHLRRLDALNKLLVRWPGLKLFGNAYYGVSLSDCLEQASKLASQIVGELIHR